jgi:glutamate/aspartate transport system substrate-binding protein
LLNLPGNIDAGTVRHPIIGGRHPNALPNRAKDPDIKEYEDQERGTRHFHTLFFLKDDAGRIMDQEMHAECKSPTRVWVCHLRSTITDVLFTGQSPVLESILAFAMGNAFAFYRYLVAILFLSLSAGGSPAWAADDLTGTLQKIKDAGSISVGHRESSIPFSYYDDKNEVVGYSQDLVTMVVDAVKKKLNLPNLQVKLIPVTSQNRIPLIQNGTIDIESGSTTNNLERQQQVAFSDTMFIIGTRLLVKKDSGIQDFPDLKGKNVVVTAGTTSERLIREMNEKGSMGMNIISAKDHGESFLTLQSGRAVAFMLDDALLAGERAKAKKAGDWVIVGTAQSKEAYGMMMRKGDDQFKKLVDETIANAETSGAAAKLYQKWFQSPIPPKGLNLDLPLSDDMKALFKNPNDKAFQ